MAQSGKRTSAQRPARARSHARTAVLDRSAKASVLPAPPARTAAPPQPRWRGGAVVLAAVVGVVVVLGLVGYGAQRSLHQGRPATAAPAAAAPAAAARPAPSVAPSPAVAGPVGVIGNISVKDQTGDGRTLKVQGIEIEGAAGWTVVRRDAGGKPGAVVTAMPRREDVHDDVVTVPLPTPISTGDYWVELHADLGTLGRFEYPGTDLPVIFAGAPLAMKLHYTRR
jgi:hypothetical protein